MGSKNLNLSMFPKDGNIKRSALSYFIQIADLVAYAARTKIEHEIGRLTAKRTARQHHLIYNALPIKQLNLSATAKRTDGIVPI